MPTRRRKLILLLHTEAGPRTEVPQQQLLIAKDAVERLLKSSGERRDDYESAFGTWPRAQAPKLAMSRIAMALGDASGARRWLARSMDETRAGRSDPWWDYLHGQSWRRDDRPGILQVGTGPGPKLVVVVTDGRNNSSWLRGEDVIDIARRHETVVYPVAVGAIEVTHET